MEEIRFKHKPVQSTAHHIALDCIQPQSTHGSPYHVHPYPSPIRLQHAFTAQNSPKMFHPKGLKPHRDGKAFITPTQSPILGRALCLTPKGSPIPGRMSHLNEKFQDSLTITSDTEALVAKISAMFPTVSETHIKILLKKYYNREAVVISALQVEKHPITTPGPLSVSPSMARLQKGAVGIYSAMQLAKGGSSMQGSSHLTPLSGTPHGSPLFLRPSSNASSYIGMAKMVEGQTKHQSPKMKLKYLKSVFPKAEETLILDILANKDNNVQKASEELIGMGFVKKETIINQPKKTDKKSPQPAPNIVPIKKTLDEKVELKKKLQRKFSKVAEQVVTIALESVDYNEERAEQILNAVAQEEEVPKITKSVESKETRRPSPEVMNKWPILKTSTSVETKYKSQYRTPSIGPNHSLRQGPKDNLLLEDYMAWNGPNPELRSGQSIKPEGPEQRGTKTSIARGSLGLAKGPAGIAKGSIYQKLTKKSAKIVI
ncbi:uncharacterized protein [Battus philenor]|uniref:uncharacterized protein isoform X2 n=1 Tax=Battus philenor TaxID=42288 RepID=UPI0035CF78BF